MTLPELPDDVDRERAELVVAALPVLGVEPGHVAEARRALLAQGRHVDDDGIVRLLWAARALPAALDALALDSALRDAIFGAPVVAGASLADGSSVGGAGASSVGGLYAAIARIDEETSPAAVVVELVEQRALFAADGDDATPACVVTIPFTRADAVDDVALHRFTIGPPGT